MVNHNQPLDPLNFTLTQVKNLIYPFSKIILRNKLSKFLYDHFTVLSGMALSPSRMALRLDPAPIPGPD
jgi:hypothetical protein